ncbi:major capsid protein [Pseudomonas phage BroderSalsa]|nr:major capsid protein [Pseudomonas phage BroderSalsa]
MATTIQTEMVSTLKINGQREDLLDMIYNIDPFDTPMLTSIGKGTAKAIRHEWQTDGLRKPAVNAIVEGADAVIKPGTFTTVLDNICQIADETLQISGTTDAVSKAGRKSELAYQLAKKSKEIKLDMEYGLVGVGQAKQQRGATTDPGTGVTTATPGKLGNFFSFYHSNGSGYTTKPKGDGTDLGVKGADRTLTEKIVQDTAQKIWEAGGKADTIMCNGPMKQFISNTFVGRANIAPSVANVVGNVNINAADKKVTAIVDFYESDFGLYKIVPNRWFAADSLFMYDPSMHSLLYLRAFQQYPLAKTGDSEKRQMITEYTLRVNNEESGAMVTALKLS